MGKIGQSGNNSFSVSVLWILDLLYMYFRNIVTVIQIRVYE